MKHFLAVCLLPLLFIPGCKKGGSELKIGKEFIPLSNEADVMQAVVSKNADIGIMDSVVATFYINNESYKGVMRVDNVSLTSEQFVIAARKGAKDTIAKVNEALLHLAKTKKAAAIAVEYGLTSALFLDEKAKGGTVAFESVSDKSDWEYISKKRTVKIGYRVSPPMAYINPQTNRLCGFDIDMAKEAAAFLGLKAEFQEINWDVKETELASKKIDLVWSALTFTKDRAKNMAMSMPYLLNSKAAIIRTEDKGKYSAANSKAFIEVAKDARMSAIKGSIGESCIVGK